MKKLLCFTVVLSIILFAVTRVHSGSEIKQVPSEFANYQQHNFADYIAETQEWLWKNRVFRSNDHALEISLNSPFELQPQQPSNKAILLIHGLSDSPYSFKDLAKRLVEKGFIVRTLLLPGHGAKPADLMLTSIDDWLNLVSHHSDMLLKEVDELWIGGFSTGANLAMIEAIDNPNVAGALLFSPGFISKKPLDFLAPLARHVMDWADIDPEVSITRFDSLAMNGAALYYQSAELVRTRLSKQPYEKPVILTLSESDSVIKSTAVYRLFQEQFSHPQRQLIWFGERQWQDPKVSHYSMKLPEKRISTGSHMSVLYSPENPFYGEQGSIRICNNGQSPANEEACSAGADIWYSSFDYTEENKIHARLSWNPYFDETVNKVLNTMNILD